MSMIKITDTGAGSSQRFPVYDVALPAGAITWILRFNETEYHLAYEPIVDHETMTISFDPREPRPFKTVPFDSNTGEGSER